MKLPFSVSPNTHSSARYDGSRGVEVQLHTFWTSAMCGRECSASRFIRSSPHESVPNALLLAAGVSFRVSLDVSEKRKSLFFSDENRTTIFRSSIPLPGLYNGRANRANNCLYTLCSFHTLSYDIYRATSKATSPQRAI